MYTTRFDWITPNLPSQKVTQALVDGHITTRSSHQSPNPDKFGSKMQDALLYSLVHAAPFLQGNLRIHFQFPETLCQPSANRGGTSYLNFVKSGIFVLRKKFSRGKQLLKHSHLSLVSLLISVFKTLTHYALLRNRT